MAMSFMNHLTQIRINQTSMDCSSGCINDKKFFICNTFGSHSASAAFRSLELDHVGAEGKLGCNGGLSGAFRSLLSSVSQAHSSRLLEKLFLLPLLCLIVQLGLLHLLPFRTILWWHIFDLDRLDCLLHHDLTSFEHLKVVTSENVMLFVRPVEA